jgi:putative hydrolase of the HAD superfamily
MEKFVRFAFHQIFTFMIPIFDLDDTLYTERRYVESGFLAVAQMLEQRFGWPAKESYVYMIYTLEAKGRGDVFNRVLAAKDALNSTLVLECVHTYRHHKPVIQLNPITCKVLDDLSVRPYLVTDGHKVVQQRKVEALGLESLFKKIYITHRYGIRNAKPSTHCFELIKKREKCEWNDMFYVADNPAKDFVNLNPLGVHTIRVAVGEHSKVIARPGYDAMYKINTLGQLKNVLRKIF